MAISYRTISEFVRQHGSVSIVDTEGKTRQLTTGDPDVFGLIENANRFLFNGRSYTRDEFESLLNNEMKNAE